MQDKNWQNKNYSAVLYKARKVMSIFSFTFSVNNNLRECFKQFYIEKCVIFTSEYISATRGKREEKAYE